MKRRSLHDRVGLFARCVDSRRSTRAGIIESTKNWREYLSDMVEKTDDAEFKKKLYRLKLCPSGFEHRGRKCDGHGVSVFHRKCKMSSLCPFCWHRSVVVPVYDAILSSMLLTKEKSVDPYSDKAFRACGKQLMSKTGSVSPAGTATSIVDTYHLLTALKNSLYSGMSRFVGSNSKKVCGAFSRLRLIPHPGLMYSVLMDQLVLVRREYVSEMTFLGFGHIVVGGIDSLTDVVGSTMSFPAVEYFDPEYLFDISAVYDRVKLWSVCGDLTPRKRDKLPQPHTLLGDTV